MITIIQPAPPSVRSAAAMMVANLSQMARLPASEEMITAYKCLEAANALTAVLKREPWHQSVRVGGYNNLAMKSAVLVTPASCGGMHELTAGGPSSRMGASYLFLDPSFQDSEVVFFDRSGDGIVGYDGLAALGVYPWESHQDMMTYVRAGILQTLFVDEDRENEDGLPGIPLVPHRFSDGLGFFKRRKVAGERPGPDLEDMHPDEFVRVRV